MIYALGAGLLEFFVTKMYLALPMKHDKRVRQFFFVFFFCYRFASLKNYLKARGRMWFSEIEIYICINQQRSSSGMNDEINRNWPKITDDGPSGDKILYQTVYMSKCQKTLIDDENSSW